MNDLKDIMQNIEVQIHDMWLGMDCFTGTKEDLIAARLAKEFMFAKPPKRNKWGHVDRNGWLIDGHPFDYPDKYDSLGETRAIFWSTNRIKGGRYKLLIDKSWEAKQALKNPPYTEDDCLESVGFLLNSVKISKHIARGELGNNPKGYHLSKHHEIAQLLDRVSEAVNTSTVIATHDDKPFRAIDGGKS